LVVVCLIISVTSAQEPVQPKQINPQDPSGDVVYICPMDPDIRSRVPGNCSRCGMPLVAGLPEPVEYHLDLTVTPQPVIPGKRVTLRYAVHDPWKNLPVKNFSIMHEKLFHTFVISQDLEFFLHGHPTLGEDNAFYFDTSLPTAGMFRVLGDFYPAGATPLSIAKTIYVRGKAPAPVRLARDYSRKTAENIDVTLMTEPLQPIAAQNTHLRFRINPAEGLEKYLGVWGHLLAGSDDLIDLIHQHPFIADGGSHVEFDVVFPRPVTYRVWVQFQRDGLVNTVHFDVPVQNP
jgi:hypothetical protein